jgi:hypothetical protein
MVDGENELATAATRFATLMVTAARSGGIDPAGGRALLAEIASLRERSIAVTERDTEPAELHGLTAEYGRLSCRLFAAMKVFKAEGRENVVQ